MARPSANGFAVESECGSIEYDCLLQCLLWFPATSCLRWSLWAHKKASMFRPHQSTETSRSSLCGDMAILTLSHRLYRLNCWSWLLRTRRRRTSAAARRRRKEARLARLSLMPLAHPVQPSSALTAPVVPGPPPLDTLPVLLPVTSLSIMFPLLSTVLPDQHPRPAFRLMTTRPNLQAMHLHCLAAPRMRTAAQVLDGRCKPGAASASSQPGKSWGMSANKLAPWWRSGQAVWPAQAA